VHLVGILFNIIIADARNHESETVFNIRDVLGTGYAGVCRRFDKRRNNRKKKIEKKSNKQVVLSR
jgi:hypothetical protein